MEFRTKSLSVLAYANGFTLWHYNAEDVRDVLASGYFEGANDMLRRYDIVYVSGQGGSIIITPTEGPEGSGAERVETPIVVKVLAAPLESTPGDPARQFTSQKGYAAPTPKKRSVTWD